MGKVLFWIVVVFVVLFGLRLWNVAKSRARSDPKKDPSRPETMVRCASCGVFLPRAEASIAGDVYHCTDPACSRRRTGAR